MFDADHEPGPVHAFVAGLARSLHGQGQAAPARRHERVRRDARARALGRGRGAGRRLVRRARPQRRQVRPPAGGRRRAGGDRPPERVHGARARRAHRRPQDQRPGGLPPRSRVGELRRRRGRLRRLHRRQRHRRRRARDAGGEAPPQPLPLPRLLPRGLEPARVPPPRLGTREGRLPLVGGRARCGANREGALAPARHRVARRTARRVRRSRSSARSRRRSGDRRRAPGPFKGLASFQDSEADERLFFGRGARTRDHRRQPARVPADGALRRDGRRQELGAAGRRRARPPRAA